MQGLAAIALGIGLVVNVYGQSLTDIITYEATVTDEASGQLLASGGPWAWDDLISQELTGDIAGSGRTIDVICRDGEGKAIYGGTLLGITLSMPFLPFDPMNPFGPPLVPGPLSLVFTPDNYTVLITLNGQYYVGEMILLPVIDDPVIQTVPVDIKPESIRNPFNIKSRGRLPVAILGSAEMDVTLIDQASLKLATIAPVRLEIKDIEEDGDADLLMHFQDTDVASLLIGVVDGEVVGLELTGTLMDGTGISGTDEITVQVKPDKTLAKEGKKDVPKGTP